MKWVIEMSLWMSLLKTYDAVQSASGLSPANSNGENDNRKALLPLNHTTIPIGFRVVLNEAGEPIDIIKMTKPVVTIIPCTEKSMGRTSAFSPHPLFDRLDVVDRIVAAQRTTAYLHQLAEWKDDNPKLNAVYNYVSKHQLSQDALRFGIEIDAKKDSHSGVAFSVILPGDSTPELENDPQIRERWDNYLHGKQGKQGVDAIGQDLYAKASSFPKKIVSTDGNAKLISSNDGNNFTFRGRYQSADEALCVDTQTSQKVHAVLTWLIENNGIIRDSQAIVIWSVSPHPTKDICNPFGDSEDVFQSLYGPETTSNESDALSHAYAEAGHDYALRFARILRGIGNAENLRKHARTIVVAVFDAATPGRLSVTYYKELDQDEFLGSILQWHIDAAWPLTRFDAQHHVVSFIGAPSVRDIIEATFSATDESGKRFNQYRKDMDKQLVESMFNNSPLPSSCLWRGFHKVTRPMAYEKATKWRHEFEVVCALWRKHYTEEARRKTGQSNYQEKGMSMNLEKDRTDRDYLYGRLLALADSFESRVLRAEGVDRPTNAMKLMSNFTARPYTTWGTLIRQLTPYFKPDFKYTFFQNDVDEVMSKFREGDFESNRPLSPLYLLGYSTQRRDMFERSQRAKKKDADA